MRIQGGRVADGRPQKSLTQGKTAAFQHNRRDAHCIKKQKPGKRVVESKSSRIETAA
jgi:hypothetical protein